MNGARRLLLIGMTNRRHSRDVVRALGAGGFAVTTVDMAAEPCYCDDVEDTIRVNGYTFDEVFPEVLAYHRRKPLAGVARFHELTVALSNRVALALGLEHFDPDRIEGCVNKLAMRRWMAANGVACPRFIEVTTLDDALHAAAELGYPLVIKPQIGGASHGVTRLDGRDDAERFFEHTDVFWEPRRFLVEEYLPGNELSVESVTTDSVHHVAAFEKPQPLEGPYFLEHTFITPARLSDAEREAALDATTELIVKLGLERCVTHTELRLTPAGARVLEFGFRPIGYPGPLCVQATTGIDLIKVMAQLSVGDRPALPVQPRHPVAGWRYITIITEGVLRSVQGLAGLRELDGVVDADVWARPGEELRLPPHRFNYIQGYVAAVGDSFDAVQRTLEAAASRIALVTN